MRNHLSIKIFGLSASAILACVILLIMVASQLLVGIATTGTLRATILGIGWKTLVGIELGLLGTVIIGFAIAFVFVLIYNSLYDLIANRSNPPAQMSSSNGKFTQSRSFKVLAACFILPILGFLVLQALTLISPSRVVHAKTSVEILGKNIQTQPMNAGPIINTLFREAEPSFTSDGRTMYFNCNNADICVSHLGGTWEEGNWTPPEVLGPPISTEYEEIEPVINGAGDQLYFTSIRPSGLLKNIPFLSPVIDVFEVINRISTARFGHSILGGLGLDDVWVSYLINGRWSNPQNLNDVPNLPHINTPFADHCLFFSADGNEAFWTSTRPGGYGGNDIWSSRYLNGKWSEPQNLGPDVNGPRSEHTSIPTPDGKSLYITSDRPGGLGGDDIYITTRSDNGTWGPLVNLGSPVNGTGDDRCPAWTPDLKIFLFDSIREGGFGGRDIWWVYFKDVRGYPKM